MANTTIDTEVLRTALKNIAHALEGIEQSVRSGTRLRATYIQAMLEAVNTLLSEVEPKDG